MKLGLIQNLQFNCPTPMLAIYSDGALPPVTNAMLLENGNFMELENGSGVMILE